MTHRKFMALVATGVLAFGAAACGDDDEGSSGSGSGSAESSGSDLQDLSGSIRIDGSSTVQPFAEAAVELFGEEAPDVRITVGGAGTGDGFERFCRGETQISDASRAIEDDEKQACRQEGIRYSEVTVANDGVAVVANKDLGVECLTTQQLRRIFGPSAKATTLSDVGVQGGGDTELSLFTPGTESGTFDFFTDEINGEEGAQRKGVQTSADDNQLVTGVSGTNGGLGYFGFSFADQNKDKLDVVSVDAGDGCIAPSQRTIQDGTYKPLARPLLMYPSQAALRRPEVRGFMDFVIENQERIATAAKIVPLTSEQATEARTALTRPAS